MQLLFNCTDNTISMLLTRHEKFPGLTRCLWEPRLQTLLDQGYLFLFFSGAFESYKDAQTPRDHRELQDISLLI
jgi:hypothetical protein